MTESLVVIVGPTASGKSAFAMQIAKKFDGEIICADSRTIYKEMDIGTAKPTKADQQSVKHHLLDIVYPNQPFTVADFKRLANDSIKEVWARGKLPIMVGGSGLYIDSILFDYKFGDPSNVALRNELSTKTVEELQALCRDKNIDLPENFMNKRYLVRAIELGGQLRQAKVLRANTIVVGITTEKETLQLRIEKRAAQMVKEGIVEEVRMLGQKYGWDCEAMKGDIYRTFRPVVEGNASLQEGLASVIASDKKLVKKQLTWFKRNPNIIWGDPHSLVSPIEQFIKSIKR